MSNDPYHFTEGSSRLIVWGLPLDGGQWLHEWGVDIAAGKPVNLRKLIMRDWRTGDVMSTYDLSDYKCVRSFLVHERLLILCERSGKSGALNTTVRVLFHSRVRKKIV